MNPQTDTVYVQRDDAGRIIAVSLYPQPGFEACLAVGEAEMSGHAGQLPSQMKSLISSDLAMARVLEDLIDLLIARNVIRFTDLPQEAREKLLKRRSLRAKMQGLDLLDDDFEQIL
jgi:hypothetical protein